MIKTVTALAPAKLNLFLKVVGKTSNNYHTLYSWVVFIDLYDKLSFTPAKTTSLEIASDTIDVTPLHSSPNLVLKVINYLKKEYKIDNHVKVVLEKNIPIGGGLGGGSSDAAATLLTLNKLWELNLSQETLINIGLKFGADIPVCLFQKSGIMGGIGEGFQQIPLFYSLPLLLVNPNIFLSTKEVFKHLTINTQTIPTLPPNLSLNKTAFLHYVETLGNDLIASASLLVPEINQILAALNSTKALLTSMSGSGATCFAVYNNVVELKEAQKIIKKLYPKYRVVAANTLG